MRSAKLGGLCGYCGRESDEGCFWANDPKVLDFGIPGFPPIEPDMSVMLGVPLEPTKKRKA
jgi:hypothetical protein